MADIINLRQARKRRQRDEAQATAAANRAQFGRSKGEKQATDLEAAKLAGILDGAKRGDD